MLLPVNYPESVHPVYFRLSAIAMCEVILHAFVRVLASQALLTGVGVGEVAGAAAAGSTAVAVKWIAKDGLAELAKLYFTHASSASFDAYPKAWKICAEGFGHISTGILLSTIVFPAAYFVPVAAVGATFQSMYMLAWYATHVNFMRALAVRHNISDVTARSDSQTVVSDTIGLVLGMSVLHFFGGQVCSIRFVKKTRLLRPQLSLRLGSSVSLFICIVIIIMLNMPSLRTSIATRCNVSLYSSLKRRGVAMKQV